MEMHEVVGFTGYYVTDEGCVYSKWRQLLYSRKLGCVLKECKQSPFTDTGHVRVSLCNEGGRR
jgi:hypothetical protein